VSIRDEVLNRTTSVRQDGSAQPAKDQKLRTRSERFVEPGTLGSVCGIVGIVGPHSASANLLAMVGALNHRGPDENGCWCDDGVALGIARLSIIDVLGGHQPVFSNDRNVVAVCNGEIYNFAEIASELRSSGVSLSSDSDVEVIPHLYERYGLNFVHRLRGMFAIGLWDARKRQLVLARDRVGKKPLIYTQEGNGLLFASEARALIESGWHAEVNLQAVDHVLAFGTLPSRVGAWKGLKSLPPGHLGVWRDGHFRTERYWDWRPGDYLPTKGLGSRVASALDEAVRVRLVSERPMGAFLSGGIDSTIVTALMARHHLGPVKTFSIGFEDPSVDESPYARAVADYLGTEHTELIVRPEPAEILAKLADAYDQPFADSSAVPTLMLAELASRDVVVALSGDGGDEGFGGYARYELVNLVSRLSRLLPLASLGTRPLGALAETFGQHRLGRLAQYISTNTDSLGLYQGLMQSLPLSLRNDVWTPEALRQVRTADTDASFGLKWDSLASGTVLDQMRAMDMATYLPNDLLVKVDTASMSCSLEVRSPFLDQELLRIAARLPGDFLIRRRTTKWLLRQMAYQLVPRNLIDRPKAGFGIPRAAWLRGPFRDAARDLLLDDTARQRGWFNQATISRLLDDHDSGVNRDLYLWPLLMVEVWARRWVD
jgi:asparagine synthase (glutamine-hydrolysing)